MKLTYLGTSAAEGFPAVFCNCKYCATARSLGGKNIRTRSQALVNEDLLIDLPCDTYSHFLTNGIQGHKIRHLLITHSHPDHLYPTELLRRKPPYAHNMECEQLQVCCTEGAYKTIREKVKDNAYLQVHLIKPFEKQIKQKASLSGGFCYYRKMYFRINKTARTYIKGVTFLAFPVNRFSTT